MKIYDIKSNISRKIAMFSAKKANRNIQIIVFLFPNLPARKGEIKIPTKGVRNKVNPMVRIFIGENSQKKL